MLGGRCRCGMMLGTWVSWPRQEQQAAPPVSSRAGPVLIMLAPAREGGLSDRRVVLVGYTVEVGGFSPRAERLRVAPSPIASSVL
jgi:hypothetical protein